MVDDLLVLKEERRVQLQGLKHAKRLEKEQEEIKKTRKRYRQTFDDTMAKKMGADKVKKRKEEKASMEAERAILELTVRNTRLNAGTSLKKKKVAEPRRGKRAMMTIQGAFALEEKENRRQERLEKGRYSTIQSRRSIVKSLEEEGIDFAQLTRPSRNVAFHGLDFSLKERVVSGELIVFLIRPIKTKDPKWPIPESLTEAQLKWSLEQVGVQRGFTGRLPGRVVEFIAVVHTEDVRNVPTKKDSILRINPVKAQAEFNTIIAPLLVEQIDGERIAPSHLLFFDPSKSIKEHYKEMPQSALERNAKHANPSKRIVTAITDARFNPIAMDSQFDQGQELTFERSAHLKSRDNCENSNREFGRTPYWSNVVIDWENLYHDPETNMQQLLESDHLQVCDAMLDSENNPVKLNFHKPTCSEGCFAESQICHDSSHHCRFLRWNLPSFECSFKPAL